MGGPTQTTTRAKPPFPCNTHPETTPFLTMGRAGDGAKDRLMVCSLDSFAAAVRRYDRTKQDTSTPTSRGGQGPERAAFRSSIGRRRTKDGRTTGTDSLVPIPSRLEKSGREQAGPMKA